MSAAAILVICLQWASFLTWLTFMISYHFLTSGDWRKSENGRNIMGVAACFAIAFGLIVASVTFGDYPGRKAYQILLYPLFIWLGLKRIQILFKVQRQHRPGAEPTGTTASHDRHVKLALQEDEDS